MTVNATTATKNTRRHAVFDRAAVWDFGILKRMLTVAVLVTMIALPLTCLVSAVDVDHPPRVEATHLEYLRLYVLPHLPYTDDSLFDAWGKYPRAFALCCLIYL